MILNETVAAIADAIREKTGKSELIKPVDFATEIKGISAGGGDAPSGGSKYVYYDLRNASPDAKAMFLASCALMVRFDGADMYNIPPLTLGGEGLDDNFIKKTLAAMTDLDLEIDFGEGLMKVRDVMSMGGLTFPEITKEQFYDLNA